MWRTRYVYSCGRKRCLLISQTWSSYIRMSITILESRKSIPRKLILTYLLFVLHEGVLLMLLSLTEYYCWLSRQWFSSKDPRSCWAYGTQAKANKSLNILLLFGEIRLDPYVLINAKKVGKVYHARIRMAKSCSPLWECQQSWRLWFLLDVMPHCGFYGLRLVLLVQPNGAVLKG